MDLPKRIRVLYWNDKNKSWACVRSEKGSNSISHTYCRGDWFACVLCAFHEGENYLPVSLEINEDGYVGLDDNRDVMIMHIIDMSPVGSEALHEQLFKDGERAYESGVDGSKVNMSAPEWYGYQFAAALDFSKSIRRGL